MSRPAHLPDHAGDLRRRLVDPRTVCERLGFGDGAKPQTGGLLIRCPWHADRNPSCSVRVAADGTIAVKCFTLSCDASGDVLDLVAVAHGLQTHRDFPRVLEIAAELAGTELTVSARSRSAPTPALAPTRDYPDPDELRALWSACRPLSDDDEVSRWLKGRGLDPDAAEHFGLARALPRDAVLPRWARSRSGTWSASGHRCLVPMFDSGGVLRSVRARRVVDADSPKTLPPAGHRTGGLVMACPLGRQILASGELPDFWPASTTLKIVIAEGEPDFFAWGTRWEDSELTAPAVLGIVAGSWTPEVATRIPRAATVITWTHADATGEKYAAAIAETLRGRCTVMRGAVG